MTNEQYIEVAEKVWGLSTDDILNEYNDYLCDVEYQTNETKDEWLRDEVNSWQGFGRTVEKLNEKKLPTRLTDRYKAYYIDFLRGHITSTQFIEATHLAALEALK